MAKTSILLVFPGSLFGGRWAEGPRLKPELVMLAGEARRAGHEVELLDLEVEAGHPQTDAAREEYLGRAQVLLAGLPAHLVVISCWSALQYSAAVAVAERVRRLHPRAVIAVEGHHVSVRPDDFAYEGSPFNWLIVGEAESAVLTVAAAVAGGDRDTASCRPLEGTPLPLDAAHLPDFAATPYFERGRDELQLFLSRGCPYNSPACLLRPGGAGWHAYPPDVAIAFLRDVADLAPKRVTVLDPAFGYDQGWRAAVLDGLARSDLRGLALSVAARPEGLTRKDIDRLYAARVHLRLTVDTLSPALLSRTGSAPRPQKAVEHALDLLAYANAKGLATSVSLTFNQPGETPETAAETLAALECFVDGAPNSSLSLQARSWAFLPAADTAADVDTPSARFGTRIVHPEWWKEALPAQEAAQAVVASAEMEGVPPGDDSYWRPGFMRLRDRLEAKLTADALRGLRSHESVGSEAIGVPSGWLIEPRWH